MRRKLPMAPCAPSRRQFVQAAGAAVITFALPACVGTDARHIGIGGLDDLDAGVGGPPPDLSGEPPPDFAQAHHDMLQTQGQCKSPGYNTKRAPGSFALNTATYFASQDVFVCRDSGGLYAVSSICPHAGCTVNFRSSGDTFHCPCHGANFDFNGGSPTFPAFSPLDHYAICIEQDGNVGFDINTTVSSALRLNA